MIYLTGTKLTCIETGVAFVVTESDATVTKYCNATHKGHCLTDAVAATFDTDTEPLYPEGVGVTPGTNGGPASITFGGGGAGTPWGLPGKGGGASLVDSMSGLAPPFDKVRIHKGNKPAPSALDTQIGGEHYKALGEYQPWEVLRRWLTPEEFRGYMKGTAIAYLARERQKGGDEDIEKAGHTLQGLIELMGDD